MIRTMVYVACDDCGDPIGDADAMGDSAAQARRIAADSYAAVRIRRDGKLVDLCHRCKPIIGVATM